jgi:DNA helicase-2/ATP-dependent DNA helicase PcrA
VQHNATVEAPEVWATACWNVNATANETVVAILRWPTKCKDIAKRMGGRWPIVERFDDPDLLRLGRKLVDADGPVVAEALVDFVAERMTAIGAALSTAVDAIKAGRGVSRIRNNRDHADRLSAVASSPTPANALAWLEGTLAHKNDWWLYRRECAFQLREALRHCTTDNFGELPDMIAAARTRARHRGRLPHKRTIGTPLLVKGLEFDHAVLLWDPDHLSVQELYVALTRASKSLTIVSCSRQLVPRVE